MIKRAFYILFIINCSLLIVKAQPTQEWVARYSDTSSAQWNSRAIKSDSAGFIYLLAQTGNSFGFLKYSPGGNLLLIASYFPAGYDNGGSSYFDVTPNGDVYITGIVGNNFDLWIYTVKFNTNGIFQWGKLYNPDASDVSNDLKVDKAGNIIVVGAGAYSGIIIKYNPSGDSLWVRRYTQPSLSAGFRKVVLDNANNIYIAGRLSNKCLTMKYDSAGSLIWNTTFAIDTTRTNIGQGLSLDLNGNIYVLGTESISAGLNDFLFKVNNGGVIQWSKLFIGILSGQGGQTDGYPAGPVVTTDGSFVYYSTRTGNGTGGGGYGIATLKYNSAGDSQWVKMYNGGGVPATANFIANIKLDKNNSIYICGSGYYQTTGSDFTTIRYSPAGIEQWVATYTGEITNGVDIANDLIIDTNLSVFVTGVSNPNTHGGIDAVIIKYSQPLGINPLNNQLPVQYELSQNYPNPFNPVTIVNYEIPKASSIKLSVYNILGEEVRTFVNRKSEGGRYSIAFDMGSFASGIYFYSLIADGNIIDTKKMILIR